MADQPAQSQSDAQADLRGLLLHPAPGDPSYGVLSTLILAVPTFGLLPLLLWPLQWRAYAARERAQYEAVADWLAARVSNPDLARVRAKASAIRASTGPAILSIACALVTIGVFIAMFAAWNRNLAPRQVLEVTYRFFPDRIHHRPRAYGGMLLFCYWVGLLSLGYAAHWVGVQTYARRVRRFLDEFNKVVIHEALSPVFLPPVGMGVRPIWALGAALLLVISAPWGIGLMLSGAVQRSYVRRAGAQMRSAIAKRMRDLERLAAASMPGPSAEGEAPVEPLAPADAPIPPQAATLPPHAAPPPHAALGREPRCATPGCLNPLPPGSRYCPRCGTGASDQSRQVR